MQYLDSARCSIAIRSLALRLRDEAGEGVISTAIAVLILAFVGAGMWVGFNTMMASSCDAAANQLDTSIGGAGAGASSITC